MKKSTGYVVLASSLLVFLSFLLYDLHYIFFHDLHHILLYLVGDIAFLPLEVLIVSLILHRLLSIHEKKTMLRKLNMVIGAFFSETGTDLLRKLAAFDGERQSLTPFLQLEPTWKEKDFLLVQKKIKQHLFQINLDKGDLIQLKVFLKENKRFLLSLLKNPNMLKHMTFTDMLWAVLHCTEELEHRTDLQGLPENDRLHLCNDLQRALKTLLLEWVGYLSHLNADYPYLYSLAVRTNPWNNDVKVVFE